ncbi:hypothetical protein QBC40DRAFT_276421 [Triangularia verruculosa]|uniref:Uncharacterized protein n=1 Tax=Triangularia verruculosa TaxID=2587418 RepID=A0AAN7AZ18_9PEZI|nr:hypothetical protein QBC40DRAFT_276421 [Triangularia verruculosa]
MNASALLQSQGWLGKGHSLDSHRFSSTTTTTTTTTESGRNARGLVNPLLISRNTDGRGIGTKTHYTSDQWWLSAFDQKLKGLDTTNSKQGITQTVTEGKLDAVGKVQEGKYTGTKGLYAFFVKGGLLEGTVEVDLLTQKDGTATPETDDNGVGFSLRAKLAAKRARREAKRAKESKAERKEKKANKEAKRLKREEKEKKRAEKGRIGETKEEKKMRKEERRKKKEAKRRKRAEKEKKEK